MSDVPSADVVVPWVLSGHTEAALRAQADRLAQFVADRDLPAIDIGWSLASSRSLFEHRAVILGTDREALVVGAASLGRGAPAPGVVLGVPAPGPLGVLFTGQGSQRAGMGQELYGVFPVFAAAFDEVCTAFDPLLDAPLREIVFSGDGLDETGFTQCALFALEVALFRLMSSWGVRPAFLAGHSIGELVAAHVAGVLSLTDAATLVAARGRLMQALPAGGAMISLQASKSEVEVLLAGREAEVGLAAVNGPSSVVIAGDDAAVSEVAAQVRSWGRKTKRLRVSHAFHSPRMQPMLAEFGAIARELDFRAPRIPMLSLVTGALATAEQLCQPEYWVEHVRRTVLFQDGIDTLRAEGVTTFLELGPDGVLSAMIADGAYGPDPVTAVATLRPERPEPHCLLSALGQIFVRGSAADWSAVFAGKGARQADLPTYAFQRQRYWMDTAPAAADGRRDNAVAQSPSVAGGEPSTSHLAASIANLTAATQSQAITDLVRDHVAAALGHGSRDAINLHVPFSQLGFDSMTAVEFRNGLAAATALRLPSGLLFAYPTPAELVAYLHAEVVGSAEHPGAVDSPPAESAMSEPIVIVGMGCRYPGGVSSPDELWQLVVEGADVISPFPTDRGWDVGMLYDPDPDHPGTSYAREGGFLQGADGFDAGFFGISPREALGMDPQQRLLLETAWEAVEQAGIDPMALRGGQVGVFVGGMATEYGPRMLTLRGTWRDTSLPERRRVSCLVASPTSWGWWARRLRLIPRVRRRWWHYTSRYRLCARASVTWRLAGGVTVMATPGMFVEFSRQRGMSADGRCKSFAAAADGTGWGEGAGLLLVERLSEAVRRGHRYSRSCAGMP